MKYNKLKAFTLAELMILLLTLSIIMAAFAPVFTRRYNNAAADDVWSYVLSDDNEDSYYDVINKNNTAQAYIGLTPTDQAVAVEMVKSGSKILYSKLIIAAGNNVKYGATRKKQNQILFRYADAQNDKDGDAVAALFADGTNLLLGGLYNGNVSGSANTSYGVKTFESLSTGNRNTAVGYNVLNKISSGNDNTVSGRNAATKLTSGYGNTVFGTNAYNENTGSLNTAAGFSAMSDGNGSGSKNTILGYKAGNNLSSGTGNTAIGPMALQSLTSGSYNTAVGYSSMTNLTTGSYNTAVGAFSCNSSNLTSSSYKTCIGYNSGNSGMSSLYSSDYERVFIGGAPAEYVFEYGSDKPAAVMEVHNINGSSKTYPIPYLGDSSVVINGNLIVRGNSYFETPLKRPSNIRQAFVENGGNENSKDELYDAHIPKGLVLYWLNDKTFKTKNGTARVFQAYDGIQRTEPSWETCRGGCGRGSHAFNDVRPNCICTAVNSQSFDKTGYTIGRSMTHFDTTYDRYERNTTIKGSTSYDWASKTFVLSGSSYDQRSPYNGTNKIYPSYFGGDSVSCNNFWDRNSDSSGASQASESNSPSAQDSNPTPYVNNGAYYKDRSFDKYIYLERRPTRCRGGYDNDGDCRSWEYGLKGTDKPYAHLRLRHQVGGVNINTSCCPILTNETYTNANSPYKDLHAHPDWDFQLSDKRLKNIGNKFTAGLDEVRKLNVYNFTFKTDKNKVPQVGVMAQDLRLVFPNAVEKDKDGYYHIRWDEMFYAAINSVKSLYAKAENLIVRIAKDKQRITNLKDENSELNSKLDLLEKEIAKLEADR